MGVNRALAPPEKAFILDDCEASVVLCDPGVAEEMATITGGLRTPPRVTVCGAHEASSWAAALAAADEGPVGVVVDPGAPAGIAYTSGTTGFPKGALHSQRNLCLPGAALVASRGYGPESSPPLVRSCSSDTATPGRSSPRWPTGWPSGSRPWSTSTRSCLRTVTPAGS